MQYQVRFVGDWALPEGVDYAFARQSGETFLFVKQSAMDATPGRCDALSRAWETWQRVDGAATTRRFASAV